MNLHLCGEANGQAKLTAQQVMAMRKRYALQKPRCTVESLAAEFKVAYYTAYSAIHGLTWAHLQEAA